MPKKDIAVEVPVIKQETETYLLKGVTPLLMAAMSAKVKSMLLIGGKKKTRAEKQEIKHHPIQEFRDALYLLERGEFEDTIFYMPGAAFKAAMATAAIELPGVTKTQINRLVRVPVEKVPIYGIPRLRMDVTRSADIARTPDIRTRPIFREWWARVPVSFAVPAFSSFKVQTLLENAGAIVGVGDFRIEKGAGSFGGWTVVDEDRDPVPGRARHVEGMEKAVTDPGYDSDETRKLLDVYWDEFEVS